MDPHPRADRPARGAVTAEEQFLELVLANPVVATVLERAPELGVGDWWLRKDPRAPRPSQARAGTLHEGRAGIRDADLFYFDPDTSWDAEDAVIRRAAALFGDLPVPVEIRNEARVHLWYADRFGSPGPAQFRDCREAIDSFAAVCCSYGMTVADGGLRVYAPHGYADLFGLVVRPNPRQAPRHVYEAKAARWLTEWPELTVLPWPGGNPGGPREASG